jgi:hypothetical protein
MPRLLWTAIVLFYVSCHSWDVRGVPPHQALSVEMESYELFCLGWLGTVILLMAASQVAKMICESHWHSAKFTI